MMLQRVNVSLQGLLVSAALGDRGLLSECLKSGTLYFGLETQHDDLPQ